MGKNREPRSTDITYYDGAECVCCGVGGTTIDHSHRSIVLGALGDRIIAIAAVSARKAVAGLNNKMKSCDS